MKLILVLLIITFTQKISAKECDCLNQLSFVKTYYENNSPAFQKIKNNPKEFSNYLKQATKIFDEVKLKKPTENCPIYLDKYIALLKDHHSSIGYNFKQLDIKTTVQIDSFKKTKDYKFFNKIQIDTTQLYKILSKKNISEVEGIYSNGGGIVFGVIKKANTKNEYIGVALKKTQLLEVGHVLLELKRLSGNQFTCIYNVGILGINFQRIYKEMHIFNGEMPYFGFSKIAHNDEMPYEFKILDENTNYIRLTSFNGSLINELDSFYVSLDKQIKSKPFLIIDLRNNTGGNEQAYQSLMPYIYTKPMKVDSVLVWVTPDNIEKYEAILKGNNSKLLERMKSAKSFTFIPQIEGATSFWEMDSITTFPKKVALIYNRGTASSAEAMLTYCMQSDKVVTIGENSGGFIGYGDVVTTQIPCGQYNLKCTTTMYHKNAQYEFVGIKPLYYAQSKSNWIDYAKKILYEIK